MDHIALDARVQLEMDGVLFAGNAQLALDAFEQFDYYVDASSGNDGNDGHHAVDLGDGRGPWQTVDKVNASSLQAGDRVGFKRGETWTGPGLTIPSSGTGNAPLVFGAYGSGSDPRLQVVGPNIAVYAVNKHHVVLEHLAIEIPAQDSGYGIQIETCDNIVVRDCEIVGTGDFNTRGILIHDSPSCSVLRCLIHGAGINGIWIVGTAGGFPGLIEANEIYDISFGTVAWDGIHVEGGDFSGLILRANDIYQFSGDGIDLYNAGGVIVESNHVHDSSALNAIDNQVGIKTHSQGGNIIRYNLIENIDATGTNRHGIMAQGDGCQCYYNIVRNVLDHGILSARPATGIAICNNTVVNAGRTGSSAVLIGSGNPLHVVLKNNIVAASATPGEVEVTGAGAIVDGGHNNLANDAGVVIGGAAIYNGAADDLYMSNPGLISGTDFHLRSDSPCRSAGVDMGLLQDYDGVSVWQKADPCIGAYEYVSG